MRTPLKYLLVVILGLLALLLAAAAIIAATFKPDDYKPALVRLVQDKTQRTLSIPGHIKLDFFPKIGLDLGKLSLSERNSDATFASVDHATISLALLPLLSKQVVVDRVGIDGLHANVVRFKDGHTNYDDLLKLQQSPAAATQQAPAAPTASPAAPAAGQGGRAPMAFNVEGVAISNADIVYEDRAQDRRIEMQQLDLDTGRIADGVHSKLKLTGNIKLNKPALTAALTVNTGFMMNTEKQQLALNGFDATLQGSMATPAQGARKLDLRLSAAQLSASAQELSVPAFTADAAVQDATQDISAKLAGALTGKLDAMQFSAPQMTLTVSGKQGGKAIDATLQSPLSADLHAQRIALPKIAASATLPNPAGGSIKLNAAGSADATLASHTMAASLKGKVDDSAFDAHVGMSSFSPAAYSFDIGIDKLDLDRYRAKSGSAAAAPASAPAPAAGKPGAPASEQQIDLSALKDLHAKGKLRIGALTAAGIHSSNVQVGLQAAGGRIDVDPIAASLYGGSASGALSATAARPARFTVRETLTGIDIGPLLKDATGKQPIEGKGTVRLDVATSGATVAQIEKDLNGTARLELRDGAVHGINVAQAIRDAKARINALRGGSAPQSGTSNAGEKTDFSELSASFRISNGVAHNDDLDVKSPLLRVGGSGDIDLGAERVNYLARVTVVSSLQGQGGPELQALQGVTVPIQLSGPFTSIGWHVDFAGIASSLAKQKLDAKKEELKSKAEKALSGKSPQLQQQLQDKLKGLFGR